LALTRLALAPQSHAWHESLGGSRVSREIRQAVEQAEAVAETHIGRSYPGERLSSSTVIRYSPRFKPPVHDTG
jgi:hypothetical protein